MTNLTGRVILIGSITAQQSGSGDAAYAAIRAGLAHLGTQVTGSTFTIDDGQSL